MMAYARLHKLNFLHSHTNTHKWCKCRGARARQIMIIYYDFIYRHFSSVFVFLCIFFLVFLVTLSLSTRIRFDSLPILWRHTHKIDNNLFIMANSNDNRPNMFGFTKKKKHTKSVFLVSLFFTALPLDLVALCNNAKRIRKKRSIIFVSLVFCDDFFFLSTSSTLVSTTVIERIGCATTDCFDGIIQFLLMILTLFFCGSHCYFELYVIK